MLAAIFIQGGVAALRYPQAHVQAAKPVLDAVTPVLEQATDAAAPVVDKAADNVSDAASVDVPRTSSTQWPDDELLVKIDGAVKVIAGSMLALGKAPRFASTALAASLIPTTLAGHRFWEETDPDQKTTQQLNFMKNLGLLGGLLIAAADTEGKPSLGWRARKAAKLAATAAGAQADSITGALDEVGGKVSGAVDEVSGRVSGAAQEASGTVAGLAAGAAGLLPAAAASSRSSKGKSLASKASDLQSDLAKKAAKAVAKTDKRTSRLQKRAAKKGGLLAARAADKRADDENKGPGLLDQVTTQATKLGQDVAARASAIGAEVAHQAEGVAKDTRKRAASLSSR